MSNDEAKKQGWNEYFKLSSEMLDDEKKHYDEHWVNELLGSPAALISVVETKIARAVLAERKRIRQKAEEWVSEMRGHDGECGCKSEAEILERFINHDDFTEGSKI